MNFHNRIMNLHTNGYAMDTLDYKYGHRDARHAAAEIANEADIEIERLSKEVVTLKYDYARIKESETRASQADLERRNEMDEMAEENLQLTRENIALKEKVAELAAHSNHHLEMREIKATEFRKETLRLIREKNMLVKTCEDWQEVVRNLEERLGSAQKALTATNEDAVYWFRKHRNLRNSISTIISDDAKSELSANG